MTPQPLTPPDLLEQAHLALLGGNLGQARSLLERLIVAEPDNAPAQDLRATVIAKQVALSETARLQTGEFPGAAPQAQTGSVWTRPLPDPASALLRSSSARKLPKPLLPVACLLAGVLTWLWPSRHHNRYHSSWGEDIAFGLVAGVVLFIWMLVKKR